MKNNYGIILASDNKKSNEIFNFHIDGLDMDSTHIFMVGDLINYKGHSNERMFLKEFNTTLFVVTKREIVFINDTNSGIDLYIVPVVLN